MRRLYRPFSRRHSSAHRYIDVELASQAHSARSTMAKAAENHARILIAGQEQSRISGIAHQLTAAGYDIRAAETTPAAWRSVVQDLPFGVVIDVSAGDSSWGWDLCRELAQSLELLLIMLLPIDADSASTKAAKFGADQWFSMLPGFSKLLVAYLDKQRARLQQIGRQSYYAMGNSESRIEIDPTNRQIYRNGQAIRLTRREFALLELLACRPSQAVPSPDICQSLYGTKNYASALALVKQYVRILREKIEPDALHPIHLETVRGIGYCFHLNARMAQSGEELSEHSGRT